MINAQFNKILLSCLTILVVWMSTIAPAWSTDLATGAKIFKANCVGCHLNGNNTVVKSKSLKQPDLQAYNMDSLEAIITQVTKGKNAMPAFGKKLKVDEIESVATYVTAQAENGWKKK